MMRSPFSVLPTTTKPRGTIPMRERTEAKSENHKVMCQDNLSRGRLNTAAPCLLETVDHDRNHSEKFDEDAVPPAQWMRDGLALYAAAHQLEEETARHLNWIDDEIQRIRQTAAGQELILLIGDEQFVRTAGLPMQIEAVRELLHTTAQLESVESRTALLELARTVTDLCGMEDALTANGDEAVHRMEQVWELFRGAVSAEHAERRQALLEEADIQMDELCGCLDPEAEVEDGKQLLTWEELRSELEAVAGALEASEQDAAPR